MNHEWRRLQSPGPGKVGGTACVHCGVVVPDFLDLDTAGECKAHIQDGETETMIAMRDVVTAALVSMGNMTREQAEQKIAGGEVSVHRTTPAEQDARMSRYMYEAELENHRVLCSTCGLPYGWPAGGACEEHEEAQAEGDQQDTPRHIQIEQLKGALSILLAMRSWCSYDVDPDFDRTVLSQIDDYKQALDGAAS